MSHDHVRQGHHCYGGATWILPPLLQLTVKIKKLRGKKNGTQWGFKNQEIYIVEFRKKTMTKWKSDLKSLIS